MTFIGRRDHFICDTCKKEEHCNNGFPPGWCYIKQGSGTPPTHACKECRKGIPKDKQFEAGQK